MHPLCRTAQFWKVTNTFSNTVYINNGSHDHIAHRDKSTESMERFSVSSFWFSSPQLYCFGSLSPSSFLAGSCAQQETADKHTVHHLPGTKQ